MKHTLRGLATLALAVSFTLSAAPLFAQTLPQVVETNLGFGTTLDLTLPVGGRNNYWSGSQYISVNNTSFLAFCIDPYQWSPTSLTSYNVSSSLTSVMTSTQATDVAKLYSQSYASTITNDANRDANSAAFQLALWKLSNDTAVTDWSHGNIIANNPSNTVVTDADVMIYNAQHNASGPSQYSFTVYMNPEKQDYLVSVTAVPEPETYAMLLSGLGLIGVIARRRKGFAATV